MLFELLKLMGDDLHLKVLNCFKNHDVKMVLKEQFETIQLSRPKMYMHL